MGMFNKIHLTIDPDRRTIKCNRKGQDVCIILCDQTTDVIKYYRQIKEHGVAVSLSMLSKAVALDMQYFPRNSTDKIKAACKEFEKGTLRQACEIYSKMNHPEEEE